MDDLDGSSHGHRPLLMAHRNHPRCWGMEPVRSPNNEKNWVCSIYIYIYTYIYIYMVVDQNSFIPERPFFANKNFTFAKLLRTPCLSFAGPMLANNTSYEDSFTTCQITPENHRSLLGSQYIIYISDVNICQYACVYLYNHTFIDIYECISIHVFVIVIILS